MTEFELPHILTTNYTSEFKFLEIHIAELDVATHTLFGIAAL